MADNKKSDAELGTAVLIVGGLILAATSKSGSYKINANAGLHGTIIPSGEQTVKKGESLTFIFYPDLDYTVANVIVDGVSMGVMGSFTFDDVQADHAIDVMFETEDGDGGGGIGGGGGGGISGGWFIMAVGQMTVKKAVGTTAWLLMASANMSVKKAVGSLAWALMASGSISVKKPVTGDGGTQPTIYKCPYCSAEFTDLGALQGHIATYHLTGSRYRIEYWDGEITTICVPRQYALWDMVDASQVKSATYIGAC